MSYTNEVLEQDAKDRAQRLEAANREAWEEICNTTDVTEGEAFYKLVLEFCEGEITLDKFLMMQATCPTGFDLTNPNWWKGTKENLIAELIGRKRRQLAPTGVLDSRDEVELRDFESNLWNLSKAELRAKRGEQAFKEEIRTASQARDYLSKHRMLASQREFFTRDGQGPFPKLPLYVVPPGHVQAIPRDARYYTNLDASALRRETQRYSVEQVNTRISATQDSLRGE